MIRRKLAQVEQVMCVMSGSAGVCSVSPEGGASVPKRVVALILNCEFHFILLSSFVGGFTECNNINRMSSIKFALDKFTR